MAKMFLFAVTNSIGVMYEITSKGLVEIKDTKNLNSRGAICLIYEEPLGGMRSKAEYIHIGIHDIILTDSEIQRENHVKFQAPAYNKIFPLKTKKAVFKLSFSIKKEKLDKLFMDYEFSKIIPLSVLLWKKGKGIHGIVSEKISLFKIVNKNYMDCENIIEISDLIYSEEYTGELDKDNLTVLDNIYQANNDIEENEKTFFNYLLEDIEEDFFDDLNSIEYPLSSLKKEISKIEYSVEDTVSAYYHSKIFKPILILSIILLSIGSALFFSLNTKNLTQNYFLKEEINNKNSLISEQKKTIDILKKENYYPYLIEPELKENIIVIHNQLQKLFKFNDVDDLEITIVAPGRIFLSLSVDSFRKYEILEHKFKENKEISFKDSKINEKYKFELVYNLNDEAKRSKISNKFNSKQNKRRRR